MALSSRAPWRILITPTPREGGGEAAQIYEFLAAHFGDEHVSLDVEMIWPGSDSTESIARNLTSIRAMLVVIGPRWLEDLARDDYHLHVDVVAAALNSNIPIIPVLVRGAGMPSRLDLPTELAPLSRRHALDVTVSYFDYDMSRLVRVLTRVLDVQPPERSIPPPAPEAAAYSRELDSMLLRAARAGIVPASPRDTPRIFDIPDPEQAALPSWHSRDRVAAPQRRDARPSPFRLWRALGFAAVVAGIGYLIADRLLGLMVEPPRSPSEPMDDVACTVFAPPKVSPGQSFLVQTFVHLPEQADDARALALEMDTEAARRVFRSLEAPIPRGSRLHFELRAPGLAIDDPVASLVWQGRPDAVQFGILVPPGASGTIIATLSISLDSAPLGHVKFKTTVESPSAASLMSASAAEPEPQGELARRYHVAFISYASKDRDKVLQRVQMLPLVGVRCFQDLLDLEPGDRWLRRLELGIDECDLFLLFWSSEAKSSNWVRQEVRHALQRRGGDDLAPPEIKPVIIEGPPVVEPWEELAHLHFNDRVLYFMNR